MIVKIYSFVSLNLSKSIGLVFPLVSIPSFSKIQGKKNNKCPEKFQAFVILKDAIYLFCCRFSHSKNKQYRQHINAGRCKGNSAFSRQHLGEGHRQRLFDGTVEKYDCLVDDVPVFGHCQH